MFEISFSELMVVAVVALLVIGPEKLPQVARTIGALVGRLQRLMAQVKDEVNREVRFEELQKLQQEVKEATTKVESSVSTQINQFQSAVERVSEAQDQQKKPKRAASQARVKKLASENTEPIKKSSPDKKSGSVKRTSTAKKVAS
ncbi:MAG: Sec-independent protein translocase protein TatB [Methylophilus sp.]|nr:Sec-independent protein translocase protein TatB [Methylophilus sp.]